MSIEHLRLSRAASVADDRKPRASLNSGRARGLGRRGFIKGALAASALPLLGGARCWVEAASPLYQDARNPLRLREQLARALRKYDAVGASAAVLWDSKISSAAVGMANLDAEITLTPDTVVHIGSLAKLMNATLVMQLEDEGLLSLSDPVKEHLPEFSLADSDHADRVTVRMLLNHTSGIDGELLPPGSYEEESLAASLARFAKLGKIHEPGADCSYSEVGAVLAGLIVQRLRGESWEAAMNGLLFDPLGLERAVVRPEEALLGRVAVGHYRDRASGRARVATEAVRARSFAPAGTTTMLTAEGVLRFAGAHLSGGSPNVGSILSESSARRMRAATTRYRGPGAAGEIGLGWTLPGGGFVSAAGTGPGTAAYLMVHPETGTAATVLSNCEEGAEMARDLVHRWMEEIAGARPPRVERADAFEGAVEDANAYAGLYENSRMTYRVDRQDEALVLSAKAKYAVGDEAASGELSPTSLRPLRGGYGFAIEDESRNPMPGVFGFLDPDPSGRMTYLGHAGRLFPRASRARDVMT